MDPAALPSGLDGQAGMISRDRIVARHGRI
jgi:hypothetical protein